MSNTWSKADLHVHTIHSDGHSSVAEVLEHAARHTDLRLIAITDHDTIDGALEARRLASSFGLEVIVGEEVSTADGHLLVLFVEKELPPHRPAAETIAAAHTQGGMCFAAHPYDWMVPSMGRRDLMRRCAGPAPEWPLDGIEAFNASLLIPANNDRAAAEARALGMAVLGGSDSHHRETIGLGYTLFLGTTAADLREALRTGRTQALGRYWGPAHTAVVTGKIVRREWRRLGQLAFARP